MVDVTEDFGGAPSIPLTDRIGWSQAGATSADGSGKATGTYQDETAGSADKSAYSDVATFANDQYSQIELSATSVNSRLGVISRASLGNEALLIRFRAGDADFEAYRWSMTGVRMVLPGNPYTPSETFAVLDIMRSEIVGTTLTLKIDFGSGFVTETTWDASSGPSAGSPGVYIVEPLTSGTEGDNWKGGDISAGGGFISHPRGLTGGMNKVIGGMQ